MLEKKHQRGIVLGWLAVNALGLGSCSAAPVENSFIRTPSMLAPQGPVADRIAGLSWFMLILGGLIFLGVMIYFMYAIWGHRGYSLEEELTRPNQGNGIVLTWGVGFTAVVLVVLFGLNLGTMRANHQVYNQQEAVVIDVIGHQWWWEVHYPAQATTTANEIHIPVGQPVRIELTTADVIHSFWVPELQGKIDMIPGQTNTLWLQADQPGAYKGECAEFCGVQHARMSFWVIADPPDQFATWLQNQSQPAAHLSHPGAKPAPAQKSFRRQTLRECRAQLSCLQPQRSRLHGHRLHNRPP